MARAVGRWRFRSCGRAAPFLKAATTPDGEGFSHKGARQLDIREKQATYQGFLKATIWLSGLAVFVLAGMALLLV